MEKLYEMYEVNDGIKNKIKKIDVFILSANCNVRAYQIIDKLNDYNLLPAKIIAFVYDKLKPLANTNASTYMLYKKYKPSSVYLCDHENDDVKALYKEPFDENSVVAIDITGFSIPDLFRILFVLKEKKKICNIYVFYTEPKHYLFKNGLIDTYQLLEGQRTYKAIPEYFLTGKYQDETLVLFLGFEKFLAAYVNERSNPNFLVAINGFPAYMPKLKDVSLVNNYELLSRIDSDSDLYYTKANNPFSVFNTLCDIKQKFNNSVLNLCVLGTKPMALGACIFSLKYRDNVKVTYPYPESYVKCHSTEYDKSWCYLVDF
jgi:hypothetical protein